MLLRNVPISTSRDFRFESPIVTATYAGSAFRCKVPGPVLADRVSSSAGRGRFRVSGDTKPREMAFFQSVPRTFSLLHSPRRRNLLSSALDLSGWCRQHRDPAQHAAKQPWRQMPSASSRARGSVWPGVFRAAAVLVAHGFVGAVRPLAAPRAESRDAPPDRQAS